MGVFQRLGASAETLAVAKDSDVKSLPAEVAELRQDVAALTALVQQLAAK